MQARVIRKIPSSNPGCPPRNLCLRSSARSRCAFDGTEEVFSLRLKVLVCDYVYSRSTCANILVTNYFRKLTLRFTYEHTYTLVPHSPTRISGAKYTLVIIFPINFITPIVFTFAIFPLFSMHCSLVSRSTIWDFTVHNNFTIVFSVLRHNYFSFQPTNNSGSLHEYFFCAANVYYHTTSFFFSCRLPFDI